MSYSVSTMPIGFELRQNLVEGSDSPKLLWGDRTIIANSVTVTLGDSVYWDTDGFIALSTGQGEKVLGIVAGVTDQNGISIAPDSGTLNDYTVDSDNETAATKKKKVRVIVDKNANFLNDSNGSLAQTNIGQFFDLTTESQIDQATASDTSGQFQLVKIDPLNDADASLGLFKIAESQLDPYVQQ